MRIIITQNGQKMIQKLYSSKSTPDLFSNINKNQDLKDKENPLFKNYLSIRSSAKTRLPNISSNNSLLFSSNNNIQIIRPKNIRLKRKNIRLPLSFLKRFEKNDEKNIENNLIVQPINILSNLENKNNSISIENSSKIDIKSKYNTLNESKNISNSLIMSGSSSIFLPRIKSHYSIREIMPQKCLNNFDIKLKEKLDSEKYDIPFNDKILRNDWSGRNIFLEMDKKKNKEINTRNYKLIEYLMNKNSISTNFLEKINNCDEKKLIVMDKLSGKVLDEKENQKIFDKRIKQRIENKKYNTDIEIRKLFYSIKSKVNENIKDDHMNNYLSVKNSNKGVYRSVFKNFRKKYWKKSDNFARFFHKNQNVHYEEI